MKQKFMWVELLLAGGHVVEGLVIHTQFEFIMRELGGNGFGVVTVDETSNGCETAIAVNKISGIRYAEKSEEE